MLATKGTPISVMLALEVEKQELIDRLLLRGKDSGRADDQDQSIIENRIKVYNNETRITSYNVCYTKLLRIWNQKILVLFNELLHL